MRLDPKARDLNRGGREEYIKALASFIILPLAQRLPVVNHITAESTRPPQTRKRRVSVPKISLRTFYKRFGDRTRRGLRKPKPTRKQRAPTPGRSAPTSLFDSPPAPILAPPPKAAAINQRKLAREQETAPSSLDPEYRQSRPTKQRDSSPSLKRADSSKRADSPSSSAPTPATPSSPPASVLNKAEEVIPKSDDPKLAVQPDCSKTKFLSTLNESDRASSAIRSAAGAVRSNFEKRGHVVKTAFGDVNSPFCHAVLPTGVYRRGLLKGRWSDLPKPHLLECWSAVQLRLLSTTALTSPIDQGLCTEEKNDAEPETDPFHIPEEAFRQAQEASGQTVLGSEDYDSLSPVNKAVCFALYKAPLDGVAFRILYRDATGQSLTHLLIEPSDAPETPEIRSKLLIIDDSEHSNIKGPLGWSVALTTKNVDRLVHERLVRWAGDRE